MCLYGRGSPGRLLLQSVTITVGVPVVRVGTWNLENLFRPDSVAGSESEAIYAVKLQALAETITALAPEVLAVQEVVIPRPWPIWWIVSPVTGIPPWRIPTAAVSASVSSRACR